MGTRAVPATGSPSSVPQAWSELSGACPLALGAKPCVLQPRAAAACARAPAACLLPKLLVLLGQDLEVLAVGSARACLKRPGFAFKDSFALRIYGICFL